MTLPYISIEGFDVYVREPVVRRSDSDDLFMHQTSEIARALDNVLFLIVEL